MKILLPFLVTLPSLGYSQGSIREYLLQRERLDLFSGSVLVMEKDRVLMNEGFGYADYENNVKNTSMTVHRIGSQTKQMTAMAMLWLISHSKRITLHDSIASFLPDAPAAWGGITIFQLLNHTSGVPDYFGDLDAVPVEDTAREIEKVFKNQANTPLLSKPGEIYAYSNFGYILLGLIIERITDKKYAEFLREIIFDPLKMTDTQYDDPRKIIDRRSAGYRLKNGVRINDKPTDPAAYSAGGLLSTTDDLRKWVKSLNTDIILPSAERVEMFTPYKENYGLGWQILEKKGRTIYAHNGGTHGYNSRFVYYPKEEIFIVVLGNNEDIRAAGLTCDIEALVFNDSNHAAAVPVNRERNSLELLVGEYMTATGKIRKITLEDNSLFFVNGTSHIKMMALSDGSFYLKNYEDIRLDFRDKKFVISTCGMSEEWYERK